MTKKKNKAGPFQKSRKRKTGMKRESGKKKKEGKALKKNYKRESNRNLIKL